ncbi:MAG: rRNA maturation RNase YbeY [Rhabdochlamydiaceae bacterium]
MERRRKQKGNRTPENSCYLITVYNRQRSLSIQLASVRRLIRFIIDKKNISCQKISVYFVGIRKISAIHKEFFNDPTPTDCMTFPIGKKFLGECVICPKVALEKSPKKPYEEMSHYLIHCLLHLIGYDDIDKKKQAVMRKEELRLLALARKSGCLLEA